MGMNDVAFALQMRDHINSQIATALESERPRPRYATVESINDVTRKCGIKYTGESSVVLVSTGALRPSRLGQVVRIEGIGTDKYIADIIGDVGLSFRGWIEPTFVYGTPKVSYEGGALDSRLTRWDGLVYKPKAGDYVLATPTSNGALWIEPIYTNASSVPSNDPQYIEPAYSNNWGRYGQGYENPGFTKTSAGIVVLRGLIGKTGTGTQAEVMFTLPDGFRPERNMIVTGLSHGNAPCRVDIYANGEVRYLGQTTTMQDFWFSFDGIAFPTGPMNWQTATLQDGWEVYSLASSWPAPAYALDPLGSLWHRGLAKRPAGTPSTNTVYFTLPEAYWPASNLHLKLAADNTGFVSSDVISAANNSIKGQRRRKMETPGGGAGYTSFDGAWFTPTASSGGYLSLPLTSPWANYGAPNPLASFAKRADGLVKVSGLVRNGTIGSVIGTLPVGYRPTQRRLFFCTATNGMARIDVTPAGEIYLAAAPLGASWVSLDEISFVIGQA